MYVYIAFIVIMVLVLISYRPLPFITQESTIAPLQVKLFSFCHPNLKSHKVVAAIPVSLSFLA
jgi:hypothetical protein